MPDYFMNQAQPIETAPPSNGSTYPEILIFCPRRGWHRGWFDEQRFNKKPRPCWRINGSPSVDIDRHDQPTHWMPLPPAPETESGKI